MKKRKTFIILFLLLICEITGLFGCYYRDCEILSTLFLGIIASAATIIILEVIDWFYDFAEFSYLKGKFSRIKIENGLDKRDERTDRKYKDMTNDYANVNSIIEMKYNGNGEYTGNLDYKEGHAEFIINLNKENKYLGHGIYFYLFKHKNSQQFMPDQGRYEIVVEKSKPIRIYVYFDNLGLAEQAV